MSEYEHNVDRRPDLVTGRVSSKAVPIRPTGAPFRNVRHKIRSLNLSGDETGAAPTDDGSWWSGSSANTRLSLEAQLAAKFSLDEAIDAAWYQQSGGGE